MKQYYTKLIEMLNDLDSLDALFEEIADCEELTNEEYTELYTMALNKVQK